MAQSDAAAPRIALEEFGWRFDPAEVGDSVTHRFRVSNAGHGKLVVAPRGQSCGGPRIALGKQTLAPGEATLVTITLQLVSAGPVSRSAGLVCNDPREPLVYLTMYGDVSHPVRVTPEALRLRPGGPGEEGTDVLTGPVTMEVEEIAARGGRLLVQPSLPETTGDGAQVWRIRVRALGPSAGGTAQDDVLIRTTDAAQPELVVPVLVGNDRELIAQPAGLFCGFVRLGGHAEATLLLRSRSGQPFAVTAARASIPTVALGPPVPAGCGVWRLAVHVNGATEGVCEGLLSIESDVPGEPPLEVPVYADIRADR